MRLTSISSARPTTRLCLYGRLLDGNDDDVNVVLARRDEAPAQTMTTLASPMPLDERRRLARRLLDPYLNRVLAQGNDGAKYAAMGSMIAIDPAAALETLDRAHFDSGSHLQDLLRSQLALEVARADPEEAAAVAEAIAEGAQRAGVLVALAERLPVEAQGRKRDLLARALVEARAAPSSEKLYRLGEVAEGFLKAGDTERAKAIFAEGQALARAVPAKGSTSRALFAVRLALVDPAGAVALLKELDDPTARNRHVAEAAARLAQTDPVEAEGLLKLYPERGWPSWRLSAVLQICKNLARTDPPGARRFAAGQTDWSIAPAVLVCTARWLPKAEQASASSMLDEALGLFDQHRADGVFDPRALLPLIEATDRGAVTELFWRTIGLGHDPRVSLAEADALWVAALVARYDRQAARAVFQAVGSQLEGEAEQSALSADDVLLVAAIDPDQAVKLVESMPDEPVSRLEGANRARVILSRHLVRPSSEHWAETWSTLFGSHALADQ